MSTTRAWVDISGGTSSGFRVEEGRARQLADGARDDDAIDLAGSAIVDCGEGRVRAEEACVIEHGELNVL